MSFFHSSFLSFCFFLQFLGEQLDAEGLERGFVNTENLRTFEEEETQFSMPSLEDKIPFLQMLQGVEYPPFFPLKEPNFQTLLKLQHLKRPWNNYITEADTQVQALELESCVTHDIADLHSPAKSETKDFQNPHSNSCLEDVSPEPKRQANLIGRFCKERNSDSSFPWTHPQTMLHETHFSKTSPVVTKERKKRKRTRPTKNKEEVENQRMTHIAVERNRRRQMNDHLNSLRSLMPPSYVQRVITNSKISNFPFRVFVLRIQSLVQQIENLSFLCAKENNKKKFQSLLNVHPFFPC